MQDPGVVEDDAIAGGQRRRDQRLRIGGQLGEGAVGGVERPGLRRGQPHRGEGPAVEADLAYPPARVEADHRAGGAEHGGRVRVGEGHRRGGEAGERGRVPPAEHRGGAEAVGEGRVAAAAGGGVQAVQQLDRRDRVAVRVVGVRGDRQPREGQIGRGRLGAHVEEPAVVGLPHVAQAPGHRQHGPRLAGHVVQDDHAVGQHGRQARAAVLRIGQVTGPPALRDPAAEVGRRPQALGVLGPVVIRRAGARSPPGLPARVAVPGEPVGGENRPVAVRAEDHLYRGVRGQDARHGHVGRQAGDGGEALPTARVLAAGQGQLARSHTAGSPRSAGWPVPSGSRVPSGRAAPGGSAPTGPRARLVTRASVVSWPGQRSGRRQGVRLARQAVPSRPSYGLLPA